MNHISLFTYAYRSMERLAQLGEYQTQGPINHYTINMSMILLHLTFRHKNTY